MKSELFIGVAAGMEHAGATITIMEKRGDQAIVHYTGTHPVGETITMLPGLAAAPTDHGAQAMRDVLAERQRQVEVEGFTAERDDRYVNCELARAAATYATCSHIEQLKLVGEQVWPWHPDWWKRTTYRGDLVKATALLLAEIERLDRAGGES